MRDPSQITYYYHIHCVAENRFRVYVWVTSEKPCDQHLGFPTKEEAQKFATHFYPNTQEVTTEAEFREAGGSFFLPSQKQTINREETLKRKRTTWYASKYDISPDTYQSMLEKQRGLCAICQQPPKQDAILYVDHDHQTGKVRGLLCCSCNNRLGRIEQKPHLYRASLAYLAETDEA